MLSRVFGSGCDGHGVDELVWFVFVVAPGVGEGLGCRWLGWCGEFGEGGDDDAGGELAEQGGVSEAGGGDSVGVGVSQKQPQPQ